MAPKTKTPAPKVSRPVDDQPDSLAVLEALPKAPDTSPSKGAQAESSQNETPSLKSDRMPSDALRTDKSRIVLDDTLRHTEFRHSARKSVLFDSRPISIESRDNPIVELKPSMAIESGETPVLELKPEASNTGSRFELRREDFGESLSDKEFDRVNEAVGSLPFAERVVISRFLHGRSVPEIAEDMGVEEKLVQKRYWSALALLRNETHLFRAFDAKKRRN